MTREEAIKTLKENICAQCPYGSKMDDCDIRYCDNQDAIKALEQEPCEDAISRQAVIDEIYESRKNFNNEFDQGFFADKIKALSPVNPTKTGHWIEENINEWSRKIFCSECGCPPPFEHVSNGDVYSASGYGVNNKTRFCPNCGARMVEPQGSESGS